MKRTILTTGAVVLSLALASAAIAHGTRASGGAYRGGLGYMTGGQHMMSGGRGGRMIERADADGDGRVTAEEAEEFRSGWISGRGANSDVDWGRHGRGRGMGPRAGADWK